MGTVSDRRDWNFDSDGALVDGHYVETRSVHVKNGPSAGQTKTVIDFHVGLEDELVSVFLPTVLRRVFRDELKRRGKPDFEPGEKMTIIPAGRKTGGRGEYLDFKPVVFEFGAPPLTAAEQLAMDDDDEGPDRPAPSQPAPPAPQGPGGVGDDIPFL